MRILAIETSCDETAVSILECSGELTAPNFKIIGSALYSQIAIHAKYGGVFPALAKREHAKNLVPILKEALGEKFLGGAESKSRSALSPEEISEIKEICAHEPELADAVITELPLSIPKIDLIAVTIGPGLEPALWVGLNFAKILQKIWNIPAVGINHMEGHIASALMLKEPRELVFPMLALLISGGHTEIVLAKAWGEYEVIGKTRDDAVGEAYDKVARILGLPYPGGPEVARLAQEFRDEFVSENSRKVVAHYPLPRPMIHSHDFDFSFSGLKTAVLYTVRDIEKEKDSAKDESWKKEIAHEFESAVSEVLLAKITRAINEYNAKTLIVGGGVIANIYLREKLLSLEKTRNPVHVLIPEFSLATDNAVMIAMAAYIAHKTGRKNELKKDSRPLGNLSL